MLNIKLPSQDWSLLCLLSRLTKRNARTKCNTPLFKRLRKQTTVVPYLKNSLSYNGANLWNSLTCDLFRLCRLKNLRACSISNFSNRVIVATEFSSNTYLKWPVTGANGLLPVMVVFSNPSGKGWTKNSWCVFWVKTPFSFMAYFQTHYFAADII